MVDWALIANLGTALGTTLLAVATFASTRSANRAARTAERALLEGLRPILFPSRWSDPPQKVGFADGKWIVVPGGRVTIELTPEAIYIVLSVRNAGRGVAVLHGWQMPLLSDAAPAAPEEFHRLTRDIYVPTDDAGFCQIAMRDRGAEDAMRIASRVERQTSFWIDVLYGDTEGAQRIISRFAVARGPAENGHGDEWALSVARHWNLDLPEPRARA
ncbi:hypothetical protein [Rathayibacter soli]|uniref:hypothetical protein n=1 Tax=Rathayibacter soli TaxID=3144168 RepID=UPI0027E3E219|nr:hypothetical protein [Glaciibacter superstes]